MSKLLYFFFGMMTMLGGQAIAQSYWESRTDGASRSIYQIDPQTYGWSDSHGNSGMIQQIAPALPSPLHPC